MRPARPTLAALALAWIVGADAADSTWPEPAMPDGARVEVVAADSVMNGRHSRILRARWSGSLSDALVFYRERLGRRHVENAVRGATVIAAREGAYFNTVQLRQLQPDGVEATLISTKVEGPAELSRVMQDTLRLLPADSTLMQSMESDDGGRRSVMLTALNGVDLKTNRDELVRGLRQRGLTISREESGPVGSGKALTLWAENSQEEATLTVIDIGNQRTVVINRIRVVKP